MNEASNDRCNSGPIGHDFMDNSNVSTSQIENTNYVSTKYKNNENIKTTT
jgi:hypothetical protein